jgi:serine phosphatase RsbU (regulator of sigma subunit)
MEIWGGNRRMDNALSVPGIDAWVYSRPYMGQEAGGDVHYISQCGHSSIVRFIVADVSGHGAAVSNIAAELRKLMRKHLNKVDQTRFVRALNEELTRHSTGGTFATALLATYFAPTDHLIMCNAGHPPPLWYRATERTWSLLSHEMPQALDEAANIPLGIVDPTDYHQFAVKLEKHDLIVVYTDWLPETKNADGQQLGTDGVLQLARRLDPFQPEQLAHAILSAAAEYRGSAAADDDATLVVLHHNAAESPKQTIGEMISVVGKMLGIIKV